MGTMYLFKNKPFWLQGGIAGIIYTLITVVIAFATLPAGAIFYNFFELPALSFQLAAANYPVIDQIFWANQFLTIIFVNFILGAVIFDVHALLAKYPYSFQKAQKILYAILIIMLALMFYPRIVQILGRCDAMPKRDSADGCWHDKAWKEQKPELCNNILNNSNLKKQCYEFSQVNKKKY